jgi:hypothetical protein
MMQKLDWRSLGIVVGIPLGLLGLEACEGVGRDRGGVASLGGLSHGDEGAATEGIGDDDATTSNASEGSGGDDVDEGGEAPLFDVGTPDGTGDPVGCPSGECECSIPDHVPCDAGTNDPFAAMGIGCPGELAVATSMSGPPTARGVRSSFGATNVFDPREGERYAVIGSGFVAELDSPTPMGDSNAFPTHCNDDLGDFNPGASLPAPLRAQDVGGDCSNEAGLIGTGDCSNSVQAQFEQGSSANDYVELRMEVTVPLDVISFSYDFAFFSTEYPYYFGSAFNDMYVGWLESEAWTGNISFDAMGNPISLNAGFLEYKDDAGNLPELAGTCMRQHAGTGWLTTTAGVVPGEDITIVFAIFDLSDSILDSYVFIDNFQWGCDPSSTPGTNPAG